MIIMPHPYGRMANRLILATTFIAQAEEMGDSFLHLAFADYFRYFEGTKNSPILFYRSTRPKIHRKTKWIDCINIWNTNDKRGETYFLSQPAFLTAETETHFLFVVGWSFRTPDAVFKHKDLIRKIFTPVTRHRETVAHLSEKLRKRVNHTVGIHIRQTDYQNFSGGKYFYSLSEYKGFMRQMESQLGGKTRFLLCSDVKLDPVEFQDFDFMMGTGHPVEDNYALATCDYLIGPPSTYTAWASFYGDVPLCFIQSADMPILLKSFTIQHSV